MKKLRTVKKTKPSGKRKRNSVRSLRKVRINIAAKRHKRALRSKAKRAHRNGTGFKDLEE